jgi:hypothetical protein
MPLRNFGLSFSRPRTNAGVTWRQSSNHGPVVVGLLLALALICLWLLAH